jgi:hypothetical protein
MFGRIKRERKREMKTTDNKFRVGQRYSRRSWCAALMSVALMTGGLLVQADSTRFSGQATVVRATVAGLQPIMLADTGPLPEEGGAQEATLLEYPVAGLPDPLNGALHAQVLHASTVAQGKQSESEASVANLDLSLSGNAISADFLMARARAECQGGSASVSGSSQIAALTVNGQNVVVSGQPNQTVAVGPVTVVINEQQAFVDGDFGDITVNALHVTVRDPLTGAVLADVVISSAHADIMCAGPPPLGKDFVTGGGWITGTPSGAKANFGVAGGTKPNDALWGHLSYIDHGNGMKVKGTGVTAYTVVDSTTRQIDGTAAINGQAGFTYSVVVSDKGEPGRNDTFSISLSNGYTASGKLAGGNIQLHTP